MEHENNVQYIKLPVTEVVQEALKKVIISSVRDIVDELKESEVKAKDYMSLKEVQAYMGISFMTLQAWHNKGLKTITIEGKKFIKKETLWKFLQDHEI